MSKANTIYEHITQAIAAFNARRYEGWNSLSIGSLRIGGSSQLVDKESGCFTPKGVAVRRFIDELGKLESICSMRTVELEVGYYRDEQDSSRVSDSCYSITFTLEIGDKTGKFNPLPKSVMGFAQVCAESAIADRFVECIEGTSLGISGGGDNIPAGHPIL